MIGSRAMTTRSLDGVDIDLDRLQSRIKKMSVCFGSPPGPGQHEKVLVLPPWHDLASGFEALRPELEGKMPVRFVGHGASLPHAWPAWIQEAECLTVTELGAYALKSRAQTLMPAHEQLRKWLDDCFGELAPGVMASQALVNFAVIRIFRWWYDGSLFGLGLCAIHGHDDLIYLGKGPPSLAPGARPRAPKRSSWATRLVGLSALGFAATVADRTRSYVRSIPARRRIKSFGHGASKPSQWVALYPSWHRMNAHLIQAFAEPLLKKGEKLGFLFYSDLASSDASLLKLVRARAQDLWPGLGSLSEVLSECRVDQIEGPDSFADFVKDMVMAGACTYRGVRNLLHQGPLLLEGGYCVDLRNALEDLVRLATIDVARGVSGARAAGRVAERCNLKASPVVFSSASSPGSAAASVVFEDRGAVTVECAHGFAVDYTETPAQLTCLWSNNEVQDRTGLDRGSVIGAAPGAVCSKPLASPPTKLLLLTNYVHRDYARNGQDPLRIFQKEAIEAIRLVHLRFPELEIRWRPHPSDVPKSVDEDARVIPSMQVSRGGPLAADLDWCDVLVSSFSTSVIEALKSGSPTFVHLMPDLLDTVLSSFVDPSRVFFRASELQPKLEAFFQVAERSTEEALRPERRALEILLGSGPVQRAWETVPRAVEQIRKGDLKIIALEDQGSTSGYGFAQPHPI